MANKNGQQKEKQPIELHQLFSGQASQVYHPISESVDVLEDNLEEVPNVTAWAERMHLSRSYFCKKFKRYFGKVPSKRLCFVRYKRLHKAILNHPYETADAIAGRIGLKDRQALYSFLNSHYDTNFTEVRNKLLNGETEAGGNSQSSGAGSSLN